MVITGWTAFAVIFMLRKAPGTTEAQKRDTVSIVGIILQAIAFALVWSQRRPFIAPTSGSGLMSAILLDLVILLLLVGSIWFVTKAVKTLGKQWSLAAKLVKQHQLVVQGPYGLVRHPIYAGMLGMFMATGLALSDWWAIGTGLVLFVVGTMIRIRVEEKLLRTAFGNKYDEYAAKVPALLPLRWRA